MLDKVRRDRRRSLRACSSLRAGRPGVTKVDVSTRFIRYALEVIAKLTLILLPCPPSEYLKQLQITAKLFGSIR